MKWYLKLRVRLTLVFKSWLKSEKISTRKITDKKNKWHTQHTKNNKHSWMQKKKNKNFNTTDKKNRNFSITHLQKLDKANSSLCTSNLQKLHQSSNSLTPSEPNCTLKSDIFKLYTMSSTASICLSLDAATLITWGWFTTAIKLLFFFVIIFTLVILPDWLGM